MTDQKSHVEHLEASLNAARREADALREQVQLHERRRNSSAPTTAAPLALTTTTAATSHDFNMDSAWATLLAQVSKINSFVILGLLIFFVIFITNNK